MYADHVNLMPTSCQPHGGVLGERSTLCRTPFVGHKSMFCSVGNKEKVATSKVENNNIYITASSQDKHDFSLEGYIAI